MDNKEFGLLKQRLVKEINLWHNNMVGMGATFNFKFTGGKGELTLYVQKKDEKYRPTLKKLADICINDALAYVKYIYQAYAEDEVMEAVLKESLDADITDYINELLRNGLDQFYSLICDKIDLHYLNIVLKRLEYSNHSWHLGEEKIPVGNVSMAFQTLMSSEQP